MEAQEIQELKEITLSQYGSDMPDGQWYYVGTYHKYNCGSIAGAWLRLEDFESLEQFYDYCRHVLHADEADPEFMVQDCEGRLERGEHMPTEDEWELSQLDSDEREIVIAYYNHTSTFDVDGARDAYMGTYSSLEDYVQEYWEECLEFKPERNQWWHPSNYVDWERMARDLEMSGDIFTEEDSGGDVMIFSNH